MNTNSSGYSLRFFNKYFSLVGKNQESHVFLPVTSVCNRLTANLPKSIFFPTEEDMSVTETEVEIKFQVTQCEKSH